MITFDRFLDNFCNFKDFSKFFQISSKSSKYPLNWFKFLVQFAKSGQMKKSSFKSGKI